MLDVDNESELRRSAERGKASSPRTSLLTSLAGAWRGCNKTLVYTHDLSHNMESVSRADDKKQLFPCVTLGVCVKYCTKVYERQILC